MNDEQDSYDDEPASSPGAPVYVEDDVTGTWIATINSEFMAGSGEFTITLKMDDKNRLKGSLSSEMGDSDVVSGKYDPETGKIQFTTQSDQGEAEVRGTIKNGKLTGELVVGGGQFSLEFEAKKKKSSGDSSDSSEEAQPSRRSTRNIDEEGKVRRGRR